MNDLSKSLLTVQNSYSWDNHIKVEAQSTKYDFSQEYLNRNEQVREYKRIITETTDIKDVYFFLSGITNMTDISLNFNNIKQLAIEIIREKLEQYSYRNLADVSSCSESTIYKALNGNITEDMAIRIIFTFNKQLLKEIIS